LNRIVDRVIDVMNIMNEIYIDDIEKRILVNELNLKWTIAGNEIGYAIYQSNANSS